MEVGELETVQPVKEFGCKEEQRNGVVVGEGVSDQLLSNVCEEGRGHRPEAQMESWPSKEHEVSS